MAQGRVWNAQTGQYEDQETVGTPPASGGTSPQAPPVYTQGSPNPQDGSWTDSTGARRGGNVGTPGTPTYEINKNNPEGANSGLPYVQAGDTGGYLAGVGITIGQGRSVTPEQAAQQTAAARAAGMSDAEIADFLAKNPGDTNRLTEAWQNTTGGGSGGNNGVSQSWMQTSNSSGTPSAADAFYQQLLARSQQSLNVNPNDATVRMQTDPYAAAQERSRRDYLNNLAEKQGPVSNIAGETRLTADRAGQNTAAFQGQVIGRELTARRDEISQALTLMAGRLTTDQTLALQRELGMIDANLRELAITNQADQFAQTYAQNGWNLTNYDDRIRRGYPS